MLTNGFGIIYLIMVEQVTRSINENESESVYNRLHILKDGTIHMLRFMHQGYPRLWMHNKYLSSQIEMFIYQLTAGF